MYLLVVGGYFINLVNKHFPLDHKFSKIFNRNNMKVNYSCMPNLKSKIYNNTVTNQQTSTQARTRYCISVSNASYTITLSVISFCPRQI